MKSEWALVMFTGFLAFAAVSPAGAETLQRIGYAYESGKDKLLYTEEHKEWKEDGTITKSIVTYRNSEGNIIATKNLDFSGDPVNPDFQMSSTFNGHLEGAKQKADHVVVFFRKSRDDEYEEEEIGLPDGAIIDGGFDRFVEINWDRLLAGEVFKQPFLVPSFHRFIDFKIYLEEQNQDESVFIMEPASLLLRIVGGGIKVTYDRDNAALKLYEGISNVRDSSGENYEVRVQFPRPRETEAKDSPASNDAITSLSSQGRSVKLNQ